MLQRFVYLKKFNDFKYKIQFPLCEQDTEGLMLVGTADRVASGTVLMWLGCPGQPPGLISEAYFWNRVLTEAEMRSLFDIGRAKYFDTCGQDKHSTNLFADLFRVVRKL
jgi:hypothetical protein